MSALLEHTDLFRYGPETEAQPVAEGVKQVVLVTAKHLVQSKCWYERGAATSSRNNHRARTHYVLDGFFEVAIDGKSQILGPSGSFIIPTSADATIHCLEDGVLLSVFAPETCEVSASKLEERLSEPFEREDRWSSITTPSKKFD